MVAAASDWTQNPHASSSTSVPPSAEEEALKRNTDCVYFLASPLTCKKGAECEYRHSEYARVNPRDCWYWLNGSCLNQKCTFRHPPLDGLLGTQTVAAASVSALMPPQMAVLLPPSVPAYGPSKQPVPCIFFQKGYCMKGDRCAFSHGTNPVCSKVQQTPPSMPSGEPSSLKKPSGSLERCSQDQKVMPSLSKPNVLQSAPKIVPDAEKKLPVNVARVQKRAPVTTTVDQEAFQYKTPTVNGSLQNRPTRLNHYAPDDRSLQHEKETEEFLRESSPGGFDVLVDADYYHGGEDHQYGRTNHEQFDTDYNTFSDDIDRHDQGSYERCIGWDQRRNPSEQRRGYVKSESPDRVNDSDLRHRLSKQRRVNGLKSVVSNDFAPESSTEERMYRSSSSRQQRLPSHEGSSSLGGRLKGRIKFPGRFDFEGDREMDRGRNQERSYAADRPRVDYGRVQGRTSEDRSISDPPRVRRDFLDGPKSLPGLKCSMTMSFADQQGDADLSFEGPKPLSVLLKRKRGDGSDKDAAAAKAEELHGSSPFPSNEEEEKAQMENEDEADAAAADEHELEADDQRDDGEYEYEQVDEDGEYNYDGENAEEGEQYIDDEDGDDDDDLAKKVGVMFS